MGRCCGRELQHPRTRACGRGDSGLGDTSAAVPAMPPPGRRGIIPASSVAGDPVFRQVACSGHAQGSFFRVAVSWPPAASLQFCSTLIL